MSKKNDLFSSTTLLALGVGLFLLLSGIQTLIDLNSPLGKFAGFFTDKTASTIAVVAAILKIASGAVLVVGPFGLLTTGIRQLAFWIIVGFWAALTVWSGYVELGAVRANQATVMQWLQNVSLNVAILAALWQLKPEVK